MTFTPTKGIHLEKALTTVPLFGCLEDQSSFLGLPRESTELRTLLGRTVLDLGSGHEDFALGIRATFQDEDVPAVISLNPQLLSSERRNQVAEYVSKTSRKYGWVEHERRALAGLVQNLPFRSNNFDFVVSSYAFPTIFDERRHDKSEYVQAYAEILRVLKPGGKAYLGPVQRVGERRVSVNLEALAQCSEVDDVAIYYGPVRPSLIVTKSS